MNRYNILKQSNYKYDDYNIVPIRYEDRYHIMKWRNDQIYHLRQEEPLTEKIQDEYFDTVIANLFNELKPDQILFSLLKKDVCIGYGGLVHINWLNQNAEVSFIMNTELEQNHFNEIWSKFLILIEHIAFVELLFHKLYVYAFDLRPFLYSMLSDNNYSLDARLKEHCFFKNKFIDVVIYSKFRKI